MKTIEQRPETGIACQNAPGRGSPVAERPAFAHRRIKVLVADQDWEFCVTLRLLIDASPFLECVGVAQSTAETFARARELNPDVILIETFIGGTGTDCTRILSALMPNMAIVAMTGGHPSEGVVGALIAGAKGYLFKPFSRAECHEAILHAFSGGLHVRL